MHVTCVAFSILSWCMCSLQPWPEPSGEYGGTDRADPWWWVGIGWCSFDARHGKHPAEWCLGQWCHVSQKCINQTMKQTHLLLAVSMADIHSVQYIDDTNVLHQAGFLRSQGYFFTVLCIFRFGLPYDTAPSFSLLPKSLRVTPSEICYCLLISHTRYMFTWVLHAFRFINSDNNRWEHAGNRWGWHALH